MIDVAADAERDPIFGRIVERLNAWRSRQQMLGSEAYDEPDWENGRLYFRSGYIAGLGKWTHWTDEGDWSAYIIEPTVQGYTNVLHSLKGERDVHRHERVLAAFKRPEDAGKFVIARVGNTVRVTRGLDSIFVRWKRQGIDARMRESDATPDQLQYMRDRCAGIRPGLLEQHLRRFFLAERPDVYALPLPSEIPLMNVLALAFDDLDAILTVGMPHDVASI